MDTNIDQAARDARRRAEQAKDSLLGRVEELGKRLGDLKNQVDLDAKIAAHPWSAVGIAFALGAMMGMRKRAPAVPDDAAQRTLTSAVTAAVTAIAMRLGRDYLLRRVSGAAKTWFDHRKAGASAGERKASSDPSVESFLEH